MATTERMGVDPLAVMDAEIKAIEANGEYEAALPLNQARAAVAELATAGKRVTDAFRAIGNFAAPFATTGMRAECEAAMLALDAALAPFSEAGR